MVDEGRSLVQSRPIALILSTSWLGPAYVELASAKIKVAMALCPWKRSALYVEDLLEHVHAVVEL